MLTSSRPGDDDGDGDGEPRSRRASTSLAEEMCWRITRANRRYLDAYMRNAKLFAVIEQVATFNEELREIRREMRRRVRRPGPAVDRADAGRRPGPRRRRRPLRGERARLDGRPLRLRVAGARRAVRVRGGGAHARRCCGPARSGLVVPTGEAGAEPRPATASRADRRVCRRAAGAQTTTTTSATTCSVTRATTIGGDRAPSGPRPDRAGGRPGGGTRRRRSSAARRARRPAPRRGRRRGSDWRTISSPADDRGQHRAPVGERRPLVLQAAVDRLEAGPGVAHSSATSTNATQATSSSPAATNGTSAGRRQRLAPPHGPLDADPAQVAADGEHGAAGDGQERQQRPGAGDRRTAARAGGRRRRRRAGRGRCGSRPGTSARWPA